MQATRDDTNANSSRSTYRSIISANTLDTLLYTKRMLDRGPINTSTWLELLQVVMMKENADRDHIIKYMVHAWTITLIPFAYTPLMDAAYMGRIDACIILLRFPEFERSINDIDAGGNTALNYAQSTYNFPICQLLIHHKADIRGGSNRHCIPIFQACRASDTRFMSLYCAHSSNLERKQCLNLRDARGETPLTMCINRSELAHATMLVHTGEVDLNEPFTDGLTPLELAVLTGNRDMAWMLLRAGASPRLLLRWIENDRWMQNHRVRSVIFFICYVAMINSSRNFRKSTQTLAVRDIRDNPILLHAMRRVQCMRACVCVGPHHLPYLSSDLASIVDEYWWDCDKHVFETLVSVAQLDSAPDL